MKKFSFTKKTMLIKLFKIKKCYRIILILFCLISSTQIVFSQNTSHFIALDNNGDLYDVDLTGYYLYYI